MSFAAALSTFAAQAARERRGLSEYEVQPYTGAGYTEADGSPVRVFLTPVRRHRELGEAGFFVEHLAQLRVTRRCPWQPTEGAEFVVTAQLAVTGRVESGGLVGSRFRVNSATGAGTDLAAEIVCEVRRINTA